MYGKLFQLIRCLTSSFEKQSIQILFGNEVTTKGEKIFNSIPGIRYSKTVQSFGVPDEDASSQTNSIYADVEYQTEANSEISKNPIEMKAI
ncbi:unnamed protein product [Larinioides sclopetarius]|uniref:Uncharacterized protein n=1 Tax=Larinioides sclopetarius TaxID=280406 RepID=A0AAV1Z328_9ARAC